MWTRSFASEQSENYVVDPDKIKSLHAKCDR